ISVVEVCEAVRSFANGSVGDFVEHLLLGKVPADVCPFLYGASLTALRKKDGGLRPIAVGNTLRRLAGKIISRRLMVSMGDLLRPRQVGYGTRGGAEAVVHLTRAFIHTEGAVERVLLKLDFRNAFNTIRRDVLLQRVKSYIPKYF